MSQHSGVDRRARRAFERLQARFDELQAVGQRVYARVPSGVRTRLQRAFSIAVFVIIGLVLYNQLRDADWPEILHSLPTSPWFYALFLARFFLVPVTDALCYSAIWAINLFRHFGVFLIKYIMNFSVAGASGDVYFLLWTVRTLGVGYRRAFSAVKDASLLSAMASNAVALIVLSGYLLFGDLTLMEKVGPEALGTVIGVILAASAVSLLVVIFRGKVLAVRGSVMLRILGYQVLRSSAGIILLGLQWTAGLPGSSFNDWISFLVVDLLVARTPIPGRGFVFLSLALALADTIDAPEAQVFALFLASVGLRLIVIIPSLITAVLWRSKPRPLPIAFVDEPEGEQT